MPIYLSPEVITNEFQILNVINGEEQAVGNLALMTDEKKIYVYGILEEEGVAEDFKSMVHYYLKGLSKVKPGLEIYSCVYKGESKIDLNGDKEK